MDILDDLISKHSTFSKRVLKEKNIISLESEMSALLEIREQQIEHAKEMKEKIFIIRARLSDILGK